MRLESSADHENEAKILPQGLEPWSEVGSMAVRSTCAL